MIGKRYMYSIVLYCILCVKIMGELAQVVSFFRHGARYPLSSFYDGKDYEYIYGELTSVGMRQHQTLGEILRNEYIDKLNFLSSNYTSSQIQVYSTAINRTIQSAMSQLYGLYPPGTGTKLLDVDKSYYLPPFTNTTENPQRNFVFPNGHQVIPIKFDQKIMKDDCKNYYSEITKNIQKQYNDYQQMNITYFPFLQRMNDTFNLKLSNITFFNMQSLQGAIQIDQHLNRPLPTNFTEQDFTNLKHLDSWFKLFTWKYDLAKANNKFKLQKIIGMFDGRVKNSQQAVKWTFLSGHDLDIVPLFNDLNLSSSKCVEELYRKGSTSELNCQQVPLFASSLIFQLYTNSSKGNTIKIRSNGRYMNLCGVKSTQCKYQQWKKYIQANLATDQTAKDICGSYSQQPQQQQQKGLFTFKMP